MEKRCDMTEFVRPVDELSSIAVDFLKPVRVVLGGQKEEHCSSLT